MTVRDDLRDLVAANCRPFGDGRTDAERTADAILAYLGGLDPDSDVELIAWHLLTNRDEIARLRRLLVKAQDQCELVSARLAEIEDLADTAHSLSEELRGWCEAGVEMHAVDGIMPAEVES